MSIELDKKTPIFGWRVIQDEQTPNTPDIKDVGAYIAKNKNKLKEFYEFASTNPRAAGLAANQCSFDDKRFNERAIVIKIIGTDKYILAIDPKITKYYGMKRTKAEGCLTWGTSKSVVAQRHFKIDVVYYSIMGDEDIHETYQGYQAQIWQHEVNHINGVEETVMFNSDAKKYVTKDNTGRNELCPCDSGKKYKKCCIE